MNEQHHLKKGCKYKITVSLNLLESYAWNNIIEGRFRKNGFTSIEVWGKGKTRTVVGVWGREDTLFSDKHIAEVDEIQ